MWIQLGLNRIVEICAFIECLCEAITQFVRHRLTDGYLKTGRAKELGRITEVFHQGMTGIGTMRECTIRINEQVIVLLGDQCPMATITTLRDHDVDREEITASENQEVGIRLTVKVRKNMRIVRVEADESFVLTYEI
jgi:hypothetical protein